MVSLLLQERSYRKQISYHHVDVGRTHWVTVEKLEELIRWTIGWKRVGGWAKADKAVLAVLVGQELSTQVVVLLVLLVLEVVLAIGGGLPEVDKDVWNWLLGGHVLDNSVHVGDESTWSWAVDDALSKLPVWCIWRPEWSKNGRGSWGVTGLGGNVVGDFGDQASTC